MAAETEFKLTWYDSAAAGRLALLTMDNGQDHRKPTTFSQPALRSLHAALDEIDAAPDVKGVLLTGKPFVFAVGADLDSFVDADAAFARRAAEAGHDAFGRLAALPVPTVAAVNGACLGGGLEIALHCDYRTLSEAAGMLAFPEVFLSILPAWGGTQLATRLLGAGGALQMIVHNALDNNRMLAPAQAHALGLSDRLLPAVDFLPASVAFLEGVITGSETVQRPEHGAEGLDDALASARQAADDRVKGATPAPYRAIELIEFAARGGALADGRRREIDALAELLPSRQAQAAVYSFHLTQQRVRRQPWKPAAAARAVRTVGVVGAGLMGAQLATLFLRRLEVPVVLTDIDVAVLDRAREHVEGALDSLVDKGRMAADKVRFLKSIVTYTTDYAALADADFVLEAVLERMDVKHDVLARIEDAVVPEAIIATNTSSLSVGEMAGRMQHPQRLLGFHFFNPVAVLPLVEIIRTEQTGDAALSTAFEVAKGLRKSAVPCADRPAFVVNRLLLRFMGAAASAANRGNSFAEVDDAVTGLGLPMGPFLLMGLVGLRVFHHVLESLHEAFPDRYPLDDNIAMLAESGLDGVYDWSRGRVPHDHIAERWQVDPAAQPWSAEEIRQHALEAVADEVQHMLDENVVADARDIDTCLLLGAGWPFFMGGICFYLDHTGLSEKLLGARLITDTDGAATAG